MDSGEQTTGYSAVTFIARAIGVGESEPGQLLIRHIVESNPGIGLVDGLPLTLIVGVALMRARWSSLVA